MTELPLASTPDSIGCHANGCVANVSGPSIAAGLDRAKREAAGFVSLSA
jgi:hypothetical protein